MEGRAHFLQSMLNSSCCTFIAGL